MATDEHDLKNMNPTLIFIPGKKGVDSTAQPLTSAAQAEPDDARGLWRAAENPAVPRLLRQRARVLSLVCVTASNDKGNQSLIVR